MVPFADLSRGRQVSRLRRAGYEVLRRHDLSAYRLKLIAHGFNTTFRVENASGGLLALRINVNSRRSRENVRAEVAWVAALGRDTALGVPRPIVAPDGSEVQCVPVDDLPDPKPAVLYSWLPGQLLEHFLTADRIAQLGEVTAALHAHATNWIPPPGTSLIEGRRVFYDTPAVLWDDPHPLLTDELRALFRAAWERAQAALDRLWAFRTPRPIHHDLHPGNLVWLHDRDRLMVFDFDDALWGYPEQDLAITEYYLRRSPNWEPAWDEALRAGYERGGGSWPDERAMEDLCAGRAAYLANDVLQTLNPEMTALIPVFFERATRRLRTWQETGRMG